MRCVNICKYYNKNKKNELCALKNINLEFADKGLVFILGKSGSGKSTLLHIIGGLDKPTNGDIFDEEINLTELDIEKSNTYRRNNVGFIFQEYNLINDLSVKENILLGLKLNEAREQDLQKIVSLLDIEKYLYKQVRELSGGEQQRVAIARALVKESKVIIADEPTGSLDTANTKIIFETLKKISEHRLVIVVTHDNENAYKFGDRIIQLMDGEVISDSCNGEKEIALGVDIQQKPECIVKVRTAFLFALKLMKKKKLQIIMSIFISAIALSLFGVFYLLKQYDFNETVDDFFVESNETSITIGKGYTDKNTDKFVTAARVLSEQDIERFTSHNSIETYDQTYKLLGMYLSTSSTENRFLPQMVSKAIVSSETGIKKYGMSFAYGDYPSNRKEICITDYLAYCISILQPNIIAEELGLKSLDEISNDPVLIEALEGLEPEKLTTLFGDNWGDNIREEETLTAIRQNPGILLVDTTVDFLGGCYCITGILKTEFEENYRELIYLDSVSLNNYADRVSDFEYCISAYYASFFVDTEFKDKIYDDKIIFSNTVFCKYSAYKDMLGNKQALQGEEVFVSSNFFRSTFKEEFNSGKIGEYYFPNQVTVPLGPNMEPDVVFKSEDLIVVGTFEIPPTYEETLYNSMAIIVSDEYFEEFAKAQTYRCYISFDLPMKAIERKALLEDMEKNDLFLSSRYSFTLYELSNIMTMYEKLFILIMVIMNGLAIVLLGGYFSTIITSQKHEIGVMRAMGLSRRYIGNIYFAGGSIIAAFIIVIASISTYYMEHVVNKIMKDSFINYFNHNSLQQLSILKFDYETIICIVLVSVLILTISVVCQIRMISKINPIDSMRR